MDMEQQQQQQQPQGGDAAMHDVSVQGVPGAPDDSNPGTVPVPAPVPIQQEDDLVMEQPVAEQPPQVQVEQVPVQVPVQTVPAPIAEPVAVAVPEAISMEGLQAQIQSLKETNATLAHQVNELLAENSTLKNANANANANNHQQHAHESVVAQDATATAAAAVQLNTYQNALALSETQKQELVNENQILRQRLAQSGIQISDVITPVSVSMPVAADQDRAKMEGDPVMDITEAEALAAIDPQHHVVHHPAAHAHVTMHPHHDVVPAPVSVAVNVNVPVPMTPNTAGLSSRSEEKWEMHFARLTQYKNEHGNCLVPTSTELGRWLCRQRHNFRYKNLKPDRKNRLMDLDKTCLGERIADLGGMSSATTPLKDHGTGAPNGSMDPSMPNLAGDHGVDGMPTPTHALNTKTKYNQAYESKLHAKWDKFYQQLLLYKEEHGHCNFPTMNGSLGRWISRQRTLYRSKKLKADRYEKLLAIGFAFEDATALEFKGKLDQQWETMYQVLLEHKELKGHCFDVPETLPLGKWLYRQRWLYRHGNLRNDRADKLLAVGFEDKKVLKKNSTNGGRNKKRKRDADGDVGDGLDVGDGDADHDGGDADGGENAAATAALGEEAVTAAMAATDNPVLPAAPGALEEDQPMDQHTVSAPEDLTVPDADAAAAAAAAAVDVTNVTEDVESSEIVPQPLTESVGEPGKENAAGETPVDQQGTILENADEAAKAVVQEIVEGVSV